MIKNLSVFFPCYNEAENLPNTVEKAIKVLETLKLNWEILIINDGSTDNTKEVAEELAGKNSRIRVINHPKNLGYGEALKSGFYNAKNDVIVYNDADGQFDFSQVSDFLEKIEDYDLLIGFRIKRKDHILRTIFKKGWQASLLLFFGLTLKDVDCGFKMIRKSVLNKIPKLQSSRGAMINAELAIKAKKFGFRVGQVGVNHYPRKFGKPTGANINVIAKSYLDLIMLWWKLLDRKEFLVICLILLLAGFFRFYQIDQYMTFLGDEGRDVLVIKRILVNFDLPFLGPATSIGNIYLGPLYYYMMAVSMAFFWLNPVAAAVMDGVIGVLTVLLIYYLGKIWFGKLSGMVSAFLYAISPVTIYYSRSSWNPNPAPFFTLLSILGFYKAHKTRNFKWLSLTGAGVAAAVQMHYLALILIPIFGILWLYEISLIKRGRLERNNLYLGSILAVVVFALLMSPLLMFDLKHNFMNYHNISVFFTDRETTVNVNPLNSLTRIPPIYLHSLIGRYMAGDMLWSNWLVGFLLLLPLLGALYGKIKGQVLRWVYLALGVWLLVGLVGLSLVKQNVYDHYLGFLNPLPYLLLGSLLGFDSILKQRGLKWAILALVVVLAGINLGHNPLLVPPQNQLQRTQEIAKYVISKSGEKPFNFALIAKSNYDAAYQYYLEIYNHKPKQVPFEKTDQLFVVCEDPVCDPVNNPKEEIAGWGWSKIKKEEIFMGVKVYELERNPEELRK